MEFSSERHKDFKVFECQFEDTFVFILNKTKHQGHIIVFRVISNNGDFMALIISMIFDSTQRSLSSGDNVDLNRESGSWKILHLS